MGKSLEIKGMKSEVVEMKPQTIVVKVDEDYIENNLIDLPFIYYYKPKKGNVISSITYNWESSEGKERALKVLGHAEYGVPNEYCYDVLLALFRLYIASNDNKISTIGKAIKKINDEVDISEKINTLDDISYLDDIDNTVYFTYRQLAREMGYKSYSKTIQEQLFKAIQILVQSKLWNTGQGGLYNPIKKEYIIDATFQIGILDGYSGYKYIPVTDENGEYVYKKNGEHKFKVDPNSISDKCSVKIDKFFIKNLFFGNAKLSSKSLRQKLKGGITKKVFLILNKWRNNRTEMYLKYETLYNRIPLTDEKSDYYRKKRLMSALNELLEVGFISNYEKSKEGVTLFFPKELYIENDSEIEEENLLEKYNEYEEVLNKLHHYGVTNQTLKKHFKMHKFNYYQALLRLVDDKLRKKTLKNEAEAKGYVLKGLIEPYSNIDEKYFNKD